MRLQGNKRQKRKQKQQQQQENWSNSYKNYENDNKTIKIKQRVENTNERCVSKEQEEEHNERELEQQRSSGEKSNTCERDYQLEADLIQKRKSRVLKSTAYNDLNTTRRSSSAYTSVTKLHIAPHFILLLFLCSAMPPQAQADWLMDCGDCLCKWQSGKKTADCKNLTLNAVPENLNNEVQVLDLSFNRIAILEQNAFLNADLHNLHKLFVRNASLQQIDPRTFTQLEILIEVDFSNNLLRALQANVFSRLIKVRAIVLNGNLLETLADGVFQNLKYLHKVELKHNRLMRIGQQAFGNVPLLSQIYLDGNRLSFLHKESFETLKRLTALSLDSNPWNCTCELQIFRDFVLKRNLYTPPTACYYPVHLRGMLWVEDQPEAFACKPRIIFPARGTSINTSKENVTLVCRVHASPNTLIAWDYNKQQYRASTSSIGSAGIASAANTVTTGSSSGISCCGSGQAQRVHIQLLRDEQTKEKEFGRDLFVSRLTITNAEKSDEGVYTCTAENAGGKDAVQMSLLLQRPGSRDLLLKDNLAAAIALMALGLLSVSALLGLITCCIYKRFKAMSPIHRRHHHHHLDGVGQISPGMDGHQTTMTTTTTLAGGTDVVLGTDDAVGNYKNHLQKKNANGDVLEGKGSGGSGGVDISSKYTEVIKHGVTVMDNGGLLTGNSGTEGNNMQKLGSNADKIYLERNSEDTLHIKYPHGPVAVEINRLLNATSTTTLDIASGGKSTHGGINLGSKWRAEVPSNEGQLTSGRGGGGGRAGGYQPDLLPAYSNIHKLGNNSNSNIYGHANNNAANNQQGQLYSPIKATRTINLHDDQQMSQQQQQQPITAKNKYNVNVQEYLQSRYGAASKPSERTLRRGVEAALAIATTSSGGIALTSTGSLPTTTVSENGTAPQAESGFSTLQRHSKSVALPPRTPTDTHSYTNGTQSTFNNNSYGYEYRQPPPPPYNSAHRTSNGLQLLQRRTSINNEQNNEHISATKDLGYREGMGISNNYGGGIGDGARQTIVTASSSLQFLTTTGYGGNVMPQRQLL
ncbi:uncharacterized protein [Eurosta solidaginis]|uniref:uncharacterized protein isoform X2 n=1 Tax=Eurosta solidaginis TaxID=178769 RepID=UPI0035310D07